MLIRILFLLFLASNLFAGELVDNWPRGKTEKMTYEIKTLKPRETINSNHVEITRSKDGKDIFVVDQTLHIPNQAVKIRSLEEYSAKNLLLLSSTNEFYLPPQAIQSLGTDSLIIKAIRKGDSLFIESNSDKAPAGAILAADDLTTSTGTQLVVRNMDFRKDQAYDYSFINLLRMTGQSFQPQSVHDSVISVVKITTPVGTFDCFKVSNQVPGAKGFSYYTTDSRRIPMLIELIDPQTDELIMTLTLQEYE